MKKLFSTMLIAFFCAGALPAQDRVQKVVTIKNGNLAGIVRTVKDLAPGNNLLISTDNEHIILSGSKEVVTSFEEVIKQLDVPPAPQTNVEIDAYMITASQHRITTSRRSRSCSSRTRSRYRAAEKSIRVQELSSAGQLCTAFAKWGTRAQQWVGATQFARPRGRQDHL
jgi:hypothetical protein